MSKNDELKNFGYDPNANIKQTVGSSARTGAQMGASLGAKIGSTVAPGIGTVVGAGLGAVAGAQTGSAIGLGMSLVQNKKSLQAALDLQQSQKERDKMAKNYEREAARLQKSMQAKQEAGMTTTMPFPDLASMDAQIMDMSIQSDPSLDLSNYDKNILRTGLV